MTSPAPNHIRIFRDKRGKHVTLDGRELLLDADDVPLVTGADSDQEVTRVMITLLAPKVTIESDLADYDPTPTDEQAATVPAPRVVTTAAGLDQLPDGTIIRDHDDDEAMQKIEGRWVGSEGGDALSSDWLGSGTFTATVLWEPKEK